MAPGPVVWVALPRWGWGSVCGSVWGSGLSWGLVFFAVLALVFGVGGFGCWCVFRVGGVGSGWGRFGWACGLFGRVWLGAGWLCFGQGLSAWVLFSTGAPLLLWSSHGACFYSGRCYL